MTDKPTLNGIEYAEKMGISKRTLRYQVARHTCMVKPIPGSKPPRWLASEVTAFLAGENAA